MRAAGDQHAPNPLCVVCGERLANEAMKPSKLLRHVEKKHPTLKDKPLDFFERKRREYEGQKQLMKASSSVSVSALKASFLVAGRIAKAKKPFTIGEELILPAAKDICRELFGDAAAQKIAQIPLSATTVTRRIDEISEDIEAQLIERITASPWYAIQVDESTDVDNRAVLLVFVRYVFQEDVHEDMLCALLLPTNTTASEIFSALNDYIEMLASKKLSPELNSVMMDVVKVINHIKVNALNSRIFEQLCEEMGCRGRWTEYLSYESLCKDFLQKSSHH
ncbi:hypothetical protein WMY93_006258 [Mugilogobius chulae]|uniref:Transposase n=1 Tax=Mugilogobius chulae TaxID=88201 RepID=A0AAW0PQN9_9GOBI